MLNRTPEALLDLATAECNSRHELTERFRNAWRMGVEGIINAGRVLIEGKEQFPGEFLGWIERDLRLGDRKVGVRTAQMLMQIAHHPVISDANHWFAFPPSWRTLHELSKIRPARLLRFIKSGKVNPGMTREDACALQDKHPHDPDAVFISSMVARFERGLSQFTDGEAVDNLVEDPGGKATADTLEKLGRRLVALGRRLIAIAEQWRERD
jgi:hypothetical protein